LNDARSTLLVLAGFLLFPAVQGMWIGNYRQAVVFWIAFAVVGAVIKGIVRVLRKRMEA
jgi:ABC-type transport system involved in cytochrome bd biosynthesis fused ATPase/permease subunit